MRITGVTVVAGEAWWAEGLAMAAFVAGAAARAALINATGSTGLMIDDAGTAYLLPGMEVHVAGTRSCGGTSPGRAAWSRGP